MWHCRCWKGVMDHMLQLADFPCSESGEMQYQLEIYSLNSEQYPVVSRNVQSRNTGEWMDNVLEYAREIVGVREYQSSNVNPNRVVSKCGPSFHSMAYHHVHFHYEVGQKMGHFKTVKTQILPTIKV